MNPTAALTSLRTNVPLRNLTILGFAVLMWSAFVFGWSLWAAYGLSSGFQPPPPPTQFQVVSAYLAPVMGAVFTGMLIGIARQGTLSGSRWRFWLGCGFMTGAAVLDLSVTFYFSPQLVEEGNPVVRALLDSGHEVRWVMAYMLLSTLLVVGTFCTFWWAFLVHRTYLLQNIRENRPDNWIGFLRSATGGAHLTLRQWLIPYRMEELPHLYHGIWMVGVAIVFGITCFRYYVSLEWLGLFEPEFLPRLIALFVSVTGSLAFYLLTLARDYFSLHHQETQSAV